MVATNEIHIANFAELSNAVLHDILQLRVAVFVVEQNCPYPEIDGRDREPGTRHLWIDDGLGGVAAYIRLLDDADRSGEANMVRVGRVVTQPEFRGRGLAAELVDAVVAAHDGPMVLDAQSHLAHWYEARGFEITGDEYLEDNIPHVPMARRPPG
jgi:ElaA protein